MASRAQSSAKISKPPSNIDADIQCHNHPIASPIAFTFKSDFHTRLVFGNFDANIAYIEKRMDVTITARGTQIQVSGRDAKKAERTLQSLYDMAVAGHDITDGAIDAHIRASGNDLDEHGQPVSNVIPHVAIKTRKKTIIARNMAQAGYMQAMQTNDLTFGLGPAGTGKTYLAVAQAVAMLITGQIERLILSRPAVEAGEKLGFLPGDLKEKIDPYLRPLYDAMDDCLPPGQLEARMASGEIEVAPLAFMRGRTLAHAFIILDEAQNTTREQMKMFLTRFGEGSRMVICGDPNQTDLPGGPSASGLADATAKLQGIEGVHFAHFSRGDVVRHPIVGRIVDAYEG